MQKIRKGDKVVILTGKDKGRSGEVLQVMPKEDRAVVRGINMVKRHQRLLLSVALRITGNAEDAEEVVQDTFLRVFQNIEGFRGEAGSGRGSPESP